MKFIILKGNGDVDTLMSKKILRSPARPLKKLARSQTFQIVETRDNMYDAKHYKTHKGPEFKMSDYMMQGNLLEIYCCSTHANRLC